jgi:hypothetical protein
VRYRLLRSVGHDEYWTETTRELPPREAYPARRGIHTATRGVFSPGGTVFTAATTDWAQALASGQDAHVEQITQNVIGRLLER